MSTNNTDQKIIDKLTAIVGDLLKAAQEHPTSARKYTKTRGCVESALRLIAKGYRRELQRPKSIGLPKQELKKEKVPEPIEPVGDVLADNLPEADEEKPTPEPKQKRRTKKDVK